MPAYSHVVELLGMDVTSEEEMERVILEGGMTVNALVALTLVIADGDRKAADRLAQRIVSRATWDRFRRSQNRAMSRDVSERVERVARIVAQANDVWGDPRLAHEFLLNEQSTLGGVPLDIVAQTEIGARRVEALLGRIDHGIAV